MFVTLHVRRFREGSALSENYCMSEYPLPDAFRRSCEERMGAVEAARLWAALDTLSPVSIRYNPYKSTQPTGGRQVSWSRYGYYLEDRPSFTLDPLFHGGAYYVQEASSMFIEQLYRTLFAEAEAPRILDLCAAPGGKTTLLSSLVGADGLVVANEVIRARALTLADNVRKWGIGNVVVTNNDPAHLGAYEHFFDLILVDAPCSGEGMFRKTPEARNEWSPEAVKLCAARDRRILSDVWAALRPGGVLIFSTCTFNEEENEGTVRWLIETYGAEPVEVVCDPAWGVECGQVAEVPTFRFYPHRVEGEGFFAAALRKSEGRCRERVPKPRKSLFTEPNKAERMELARWVGQPDWMQFARVGDSFYAYYRAAFPAVRQLAEGLSVVASGVLCGGLYGGKLKPEHPLAMFHDLAAGVTPRADLTLEEALDYLRKKETDPSLLQEGINLVTYEGLPLGWIKRIGRRCNNLYPMGLRIAHL